MKRRGILVITVVVSLMISEKANSQSYPEHYRYEKIITIPIGSGSGEISVEYSALGRFAKLPDVIAVDGNGDFILGSRLQNATVQEFDNNGKFMRVIARRGPNVSNVNYPFKVAIDSNNSIYIIDAYKYLKSGFVTGGSSIKKFDANGQFAYDVAYGSIRQNPGKHDYISNLWVTPGGSVYVQDEYSSKSEKNQWGYPELERGIFGINESGRVVGAVDSRFYKNYQGEMLKLGSVRKGKNVTFTVTYFTQKNREVIDKQFRTTESQLNLERTSEIQIENADEPKFLGVDHAGNLYFGVKEEYESTGSTVNILPKNVIYKYSPSSQPLAKIEFPQTGGKQLVDSGGDVYWVNLAVKNPKRFTEGDHIEIQKWVEAK